MASTTANAATPALEKDRASARATEDSSAEMLLEFEDDNYSAGRITASTANTPSTAKTASIAKTASAPQSLEKSAPASAQRPHASTDTLQTEVSLDTLEIYDDTRVGPSRESLERRAQDFTFIEEGSEADLDAFIKKGKQVLASKVKSDELEIDCDEQA